MILLIAVPEAIAWRDVGQYVNFFTSLYAFVFLLTVFSVLGLFYAIFNNYGLAWISTFLPVFLLAQINSLKYINNSKPLFPWDVMIVWEGLKAANSMADPRKIVLLTLAIFLAGVLAAVVIISVLPKFSLGKFRKRMVIFVISLLVLISTGLSQRFNIRPSKSNDSFIQTVDLEAEYLQKGFFVAFLNNITGLPKIYVENYSEETISKITDSLSEAGANRDNFQPDIIVLVSESFFDITKLSHVKYSEPVNPFFQELKKQNSIKWFSPTFGGQTANAEFEMLTGFPLVLFSPQVVPYRIYLRRKTESIASVLNSNGYKSIMIHPYIRNFWSRNTVVPNLGFDEFIALENMKYTEKRGGFTSDDSLVSEAIDVLEREKQPVFLYLMTVQNHYPFKAGRYDDYEDAVKVSSDRLNEAENGLLESYANGVLDSDRALRRLVEYIKTNSNRPTLVLFHGDHLPTLYGSKIYAKLGYELDDNDLSRYKVDGVVWSNYTKELSDNAGYQMCYMPMKVLQWAKQPMGNYFRFIEQLSEDYSILHTGGIYNSKGNKVPSSDFLSSETGYNLRHLVYDLMFGQSYSISEEYLDD
ncbi:MAG: LTA synthase family protein [Anaerohalosphaeraceae bacterium]|nr:LTA synthase family protein [Anaerohalosphaeraceae bacterium]